MNTKAKLSVFERYPKTTLSIVIISFVLLIDILTANLLFTLGLYTPQYKIEKYYRIPHPVFHHSLATNITHSNAKWGPLGYHVNTNSLGFKDNSARKVNPVPENKRLIIIGDSFTEGVGYAHPDTFVGKIEAALANKNIEVLNAGVSSYAPVIYWRKIKYLLETEKLQFNHLLVMIDISDIQDEAMVYALDNSQNVIDAPTAKSNELDERFKRFITENTFLLSNLRVWARNLRNKNKTSKTIDHSLNVFRGMWTYDDRAYQEYGKKGVEIALQNMNKLSGLLKQHHIKLTVGVYPWPDQINNKDLNSKQVKIWENWTQQNNAGFINLFPVFINQSAPRKSIEKNFILGDVHWNKDGHKLVADTILKHMQKSF